MRVDQPAVEEHPTSENKTGCQNEESGREELLEECAGKIINSTLNSCCRDSSVKLLISILPLSCLLVSLGFSLLLTRAFSSHRRTEIYPGFALWHSKGLYNMP